MSSENDVVLKGKVTECKPPRVVDFEELDKKTVDTLVDSIKYIATVSGVVLALYSQFIQKHLETIGPTSDIFAKTILFFPTICWFLSILASVFGIFPDCYKARNDYEKEKAIVKIRSFKSCYLTIALVMFVFGLVGFMYVIISQIWKFYPFNIIMP